VVRSTHLPPETWLPTEQEAGCEPEASNRCAEEKPLCLCRESNPDSQMAQYVMWPLYRPWYNVSGDIYALTKILYVILVSPLHSRRSRHDPDYRRSSWARHRVFW